MAGVAETTSVSAPLCAPSRVPHRADAAASRQRHASEEQQPPGHHRGLCGSRHRGGGGGGGGLDLHAAFLRPAEEVGADTGRFGLVRSRSLLTSCRPLVQEEGEPQRQQKKRQPEGPEASRPLDPPRGAGDEEHGESRQRGPLWP